MDDVDKPILVALGIYFPGYSFTRVFDALLTELSNYYTIHWSGIAYKGEVQEFENYTLHPSNVKGGDIFGAHGAAALAEEVKADTILLLNDFYLLKNYKNAWQHLKEQGIKLLAYVPMDGLINDVDIVEQCLFLDHLVLYHKAAKQDVEGAISSFLNQNPSKFIDIPQLSYHFHGVDCKTFTPPISDVQKHNLKKQLFDVPSAENAIFILNANRYNERKDISSSIYAFEKALPLFKHPCYLVLHTPNLAAEKRIDLEKIIDNSSAKQKILLNPLGENYVDDAKLADLYRACDIGINSSYGEGWGMISFEHAACGAAQIVPDHSACGELWKDNGVVVPSIHSVQLTTNPFLMYAVDVSLFADQLVKLVNDSVYLKTASQSCLDHSRKDAFNWEKIAKNWYETLRPKKLEMTV